MRLFFFHYDCRVDGDAAPHRAQRARPASSPTRSSPSSGGVLWDRATQATRADGAARPAGRSLREARASARDRGPRLRRRATPCDCFGPGFERAPAARAHAAHPDAAACCFLDGSTDFDPRGGPWGRGYLRAETADHARRLVLRRPLQERPCMPGTLMFEGCLQAMAFYLAALGYTSIATAGASSRCPSETYLMRCRGQVTPDRRSSSSTRCSSRRSTTGPCPRCTPTCSCTVDGLKAFHARRVGLRLVPDWPLDDWRHAPAARIAGAHAPLRRRAATSSRSRASSTASPSTTLAARLRLGPAVRRVRARCTRASTAPAASPACPGRRTTS